MKKKLLSIIIPTRDRLDLLEKLLISLNEKIEEHDLIEVILISDIDDFSTTNLIKKYMENSKFNLKNIITEQKPILDLPNDYYSLGLKNSEETYFKWILGNDCELNSIYPEKILMSLLDEKKDILNNIDTNQQYYYIVISDDTHWKPDGHVNNSHDSCCFPILSSNYCTDFDEFFPKDYRTWGGDNVLYEMVTKNEKFTIIHLYDKISITHYSAHNKKYQRDALYYRMSQNRNDQR